VAGVSRVRGVQAYRDVNPELTPCAPGFSPGSDIVRTVLQDAPLSENSSILPDPLA
jgi:hypothetical protein